MWNHKHRLIFKCKSDFCYFQTFSFYIFSLYIDTCVHTHVFTQIKMMMI